MMTSKSSVLALGVLAWFSLMVGCSESPPEAVTVVVPPAKQAVPVAAATAGSGEASAVEAAPASPEFVYDPSGRRDPFESLVTLKKPAGPSLDVPKTPLQSYELGQLRLIGVIVGKGQPRAMVVAPDGKSYILTKGIKVGKNDGVVKEISSEAVKIEEQYFEFTGEVRKSIQLIQLPKREGV